MCAVCLGNDATITTWLDAAIGNPAASVAFAPVLDTATYVIFWMISVVAKSETARRHQVDEMKYHQNKDERIFLDPGYIRRRSFLAPYRQQCLCLGYSQSDERETHEWTLICNPVHSPSAII
jgi:hypothetical protein